MSSDREVTKAEGAHTPSQLPASYLELEPAVSGSVFPQPFPQIWNPRSQGDPCCAQHDSAGLHALGPSCTTAALGRRGEKGRSCLFLCDNSLKQLSYIFALVLDVHPNPTSSCAFIPPGERAIFWYQQSPCLFTKLCWQKVSCGQIATKHFKISSDPAYPNTSKPKDKQNKTKNFVVSMVRSNVTFFLHHLSQTPEQGRGSRDYCLLFHTLM